MYFSQVKSISIHAPLTGSDTDIEMAMKIGIVFQSTLPLRGATGGDKSCCQIGTISIHAPLTGSDQPISGSEQLTQFQSTLPLRGATLCSTNNYLHQGHFNPRSPYGERHDRGDTKMIIRYFNPRSPYGERLAILTSRRFQE